MDKYRKLFSNTASLLLGKFGSKLLVFFMLPLYTNCLSPTEYGISDLITQCAVLLIPVVALGLNTGLFRCAANPVYCRKKVFSTAVRLIICSTIVFWCLSPLLYLVKAFHGYGWLVILYVTTAVWHALLAEFVRGIGRIRLFSWQGVLNTCVAVLCNVTFLLGLKIGLVGYVLSVVIGDAVTGIFLLFSAKIWQYFSFSAWDGKLARDMLKFCLPLIPTDLCWWITSLSDRLIVTGICGEAVNGIYAVANKIPTLLTMVAGVFSEAWQSSAVEEAREKGAYNAFFSEIYVSFSSVIFFAGSGLIWLNRWISSWLYAADYYSAWQTVPWLILATIFTSFVHFLGTDQLVRWKSWQSMWTAAVGAGSNIILNLILIPRYAAIGAAIATFVSYVLAYIARSVYVTHKGINVCAIRTMINTILLMGQASLTIMDVPNLFLWEALFVIAVAALNGKHFVLSVIRVMQTIKSRKNA